MRVVFLQCLSEASISYLHERLAEHDLVFLHDVCERSRASSLRDADVVVGNGLTPAVVDGARSMRAFLSAASGFAPQTVQLLRKKGDVQVANSHRHSSDVAEHAIALALSAARFIGRGDRELRSGRWSFRPSADTGIPLRGSKVLIVGYGAIGRHIARFLRGFEADVVGLRRSVRGAFRDGYARLAPVSELVAQLGSADFLFVCVPLNDETTGLIKARELAVMKKNSVLVNVARGPIIDEKALYDALAARRIAAAGIDVWYRYPRHTEGDAPVMPAESPFQSLDNVVMSPHRAASGPGFSTSHWDDVVENVRRLAAGQPVLNHVPLD